jgi:16S rRNA processing protein RimM
MRVIIGRIGRPHGIRGEVVIGVRTDEPDLRFAVGAVLDAERTLGDPRVGASSQAGPADPGELTVASARWHSGQLLVGFAGVMDRTAASELTGSWLTVDSSQLPETGDPDEFRDHELIGLAVRTSSGQAVGVVTDVLHYGQDLLVVRADDPGQDGAVQDGAVQDGAGRGSVGRGSVGRPGASHGAEHLVPFVKAIVPEVDLSSGVIVIDPPPGLLDPAELDSAKADSAERE